MTSTATFPFPCAVSAAQTLLGKGATRVIVLCSHGILAGSALEDIQQSCIDEVVVTNTISQKGRVERCSKLRVISVHDILAEAIRRVHNGESTATMGAMQMDIA